MKRNGLERQSLRRSVSEGDFSSGRGYSVYPFKGDSQDRLLWWYKKMVASTSMHRHPRTTSKNHFNPSTSIHPLHPSTSSIHFIHPLQSTIDIRHSTTAMLRP
ncbi:unnamed protein product [Penicillium roqueforti FM164]|uniref:Genomic scaffold, ProqFM164S02 n=1 Tax=Penicillium roqueforti (strain FM164) TaxID=1365484 RepID=W6QUE4_PENRF|nr:unnamed protein product [Penicillium roqueforti FM164]